MFTIIKLRRQGVHSDLKIASHRQTANGRKQGITTSVDAIMSCHCQNRIWINSLLRIIGHHSSIYVHSFNRKKYKIFIYLHLHNPSIYFVVLPG